MFLDSPYYSFAIHNQLNIVESISGFPFIEIENEYASAVISIYGAQVLSYQKNTDAQDKDLLFISENAYFKKGKAIKGGIPICWPWFGKDQEGVGKQMHGFARNLLWQIEETKTLNNGETQIILSLTESKETIKLWPHEFKLLLTINVGKTLKLSLQTLNTGKKNFKITQALHAYFAVEDIHQTKILGLNEISYLDKVDGATESGLQKDVVRISKEVDRIYLDVPPQLSLTDESSKRVVTIKANGSKTAIIWNPWINISQQSGDLVDDAYKRFVCIETANAVEDILEIKPGKSYQIEAEYDVI